MGMPAGKIEPEPLVSARVKVRPKAQLTLPEEIRRALHISEGDEVEFAVHDDEPTTSSPSAWPVTMLAMPARPQV
jgi:AbrB family looped-hinge helix DNA binding protein